MGIQCTYLKMACTRNQRTEFGDPRVVLAPTLGTFDRVQFNMLTTIAGLGTIALIYPVPDF